MTKMKYDELAWLYVAQRSNKNLKRGDLRLIREGHHLIWLGTMTTNEAGQQYSNVKHLGVSYRVNHLLWEAAFGNGLHIAGKGSIPEGRTLSRVKGCTQERCMLPQHQALTAVVGGPSTRRQQTPTCTEPRCKRDHVANGKCRPHYDWARRQTKPADNVTPDALGGPDATLLEVAERVERAEEYRDRHGLPPLRGGQAAT